MFVGTCYSEFPLCTSEEMTKTFNGEVVEYDILIDQELIKDINVKQENSSIVYINMEESFITDTNK